MGFLKGAVAGLLDAVAVLGGRNGGGNTADGDDEVMGVTEREDEPSKRRRRLLRGYVSKVLGLLLDLLSYPQTRTHVAPYLSLRHLVVLLAPSRL